MRQVAQTRAIQQHAGASVGMATRDSGEGIHTFTDNRPSAIAQRQLIAGMAHSPRVAVQRAQLAAIRGEPAAQRVASAASPKANNTGLPDNLKSGVESLSGMSMDHVKVHYNSPQPAQLNALAYAQGSDIHVAPGQEKHVPHEAWHVVQQAQGRVRPTLQMKDGAAVNDDAGLEREADTFGALAMSMSPAQSKTALVQLKAPTSLAGGGKPIQRIDTQMQGPPANLPHAATSNAAYPGHAVNIPGSNASNCANGMLSIRTAGERFTPGAQSNPGTPADLRFYNNLGANNWYSRAGGLARDRNLAQTATKMHAINHRLDPGPTQGTPNNIFMGTAASNNPNHLNLVERPVIASIGFVGNNAAYEAEMVNARKTTDTTGAEVLYWTGNSPAAAGINAAAIDHATLQDGIGDSTNPATPINVGGMNTGGNDEDGQVLVLGPTTPTNNFYHAYVDYRITPNYGGIPAYVTNNINIETADDLVNPDINRTARLGTFPGWAVNAFPQNFTATVTYYTASYKYLTNNLYYVATETDTYSTGL